MSEYSIRPHHMLCLQFFEGKGYSDEFSKNMMKIKDSLDSEDPVVKIVKGVDDICFLCPNRKDKLCKDEELVNSYDQRVMENVEGHIGDKISWSELSGAVHSSIIENGKMTGICSDCQWAEICLSKAKKCR